MQIKVEAESSQFEGIQHQSADQPVIGAELSNPVAREYKDLICIYKQADNPTQLTTNL